MRGRYPSQQSLLSSVSTSQHSQHHHQQQQQLHQLQQQQLVDPFRKNLRGRLKPAICRIFKKVHEQCRISYSITDDAQDYLENYAIEKLATLFEPQAPTDICEAEEKLGLVYASCNLDQEQINEYRDQATRKKKKNSTMYDAIHKSVRCDESVCLFIVLITEYVLSEILRVSLTYMMKIKVAEIKRLDIRIVVDTFFSNQASPVAELDYMATFPNEYRQAINELIYFEETFAQQLQIIGQLFKQPLVDLCPSSPDVDTIFSALSAITECTNFLYVALDDSRNITEHPPIGHCFYELSEEGHFDSYAKYAQDILSGKCRERLLELLDNRQVQEKFESVGRDIELQAARHHAHYSLLSSSLAPVPPAPSGSGSKKHSEAGAVASEGSNSQLSSHPNLAASESSAASTSTLFQGGSASAGLPASGLDQCEEIRAVMLLACRYLLPKLLLVPIYHFLYYDRILERFEQLQEKNMRHCNRNGNNRMESDAIEDADSAAAQHSQQQSQSSLVCGSPVATGFSANRRRSSSSLPVEVCSDDRDTIVQTRSILVSTRHRVKRTLDEFERRPVSSSSSSSTVPTMVGGGDDGTSLGVSPTGGLTDFGAGQLDIDESTSVAAASVASCRLPNNSNSNNNSQQQRAVLLNPLASRLFFHTSMSAPDSKHTDRACNKKLAQLRSMTRSPELDQAKPRCTIFYKEGALYQLERTGRFQERRVYLFNNRLFVLKAAKTLPLRSINEEYRLKRTVFLLQHRFLLIDHARSRAAASDDDMHSFSIEYLPPPPDNAEGGASSSGSAPIKQRITFATRSELDKQEWMLILIYLQSYHMFEEYLSLKGLTDAPEAIHFPNNPREYEYWEPDSDKVLELEENCENSSSESHIIRRATLNKMIERMTHYSGNIDSRLMKVFLMTYRSFCTPQHLLTKLISRFNFPEYTYVDFQTDDSLMSVAQAQLRKREFEDKYCRKVRLRVLKVMTTWIENYFHDFSKCPELIDNLREFLNGPYVDKLYDIKKFQVPNLLKQLDRMSRGEGRRELPQSIEDYPEVLWHTARDKRDFNIMTLHPLELARQITLYMFSLYMCIQPWELVTGDWMKTKEKQLRAPNVHNLIRYTNRLTWWCCYNVLHTPNLEERRCVLLRIYEIMKHFRSLNNFLGLAALDSVFVNSSIQYIRLQHTWKLIKNGKDNKFLEQVQELVSNGNTMRQYDELLRTLDTACVPNLRYHLSLIFRLLEINRVKGDQQQQQQQQQLTASKPEALTPANTDASVMIPFFCYRQVAERIDELLKAKDTRYQLREEPSIQEFVRAINPMRDLDLEEVDDTNQNQRLLDNVFYQLSNQLEPKDADEDSLKRSGAKKFTAETLRSPTNNGGGSGAGAKSAKKLSGAVGGGGGSGTWLTSPPFQMVGSRPTSPLRDAQLPATPYQIPQSGKSSGGGSSGLTSPNGPIAQSPIVEDLTRQESSDHSRSISDPVTAAAVGSSSSPAAAAAAAASAAGAPVTSHSNSGSGGVSSQLPPLPPRQSAGLRAASATNTVNAAPSTAAPPLPPRARKQAIPQPPTLPPRTSLRSSSLSQSSQQAQEL